MAFASQASLRYDWEFATHRFTGSARIDPWVGFLLEGVTAACRDLEEGDQ